MLISIVVAAAENGVIGNKGRLPWRLPGDMAQFRALTMGKPVIMGRKTFQSLPRPLDGRDNIVVTRDPAFRSQGATVASSLDGALALAEQCADRRGVGEAFIIGGGDIYRQALSVAGRIYLTRVHATLPGDTVFPAVDPAVWRLVREEPLAPRPDDQYSATLQVFDRKSPP
jgi:dihydrofolate reductase